MIKSKNEKLLVSLIGFISSFVSYVFTIIMLMSFAETRTEKFLYFLCGVIIDGVKWFSLITLIKYYRARLYKNVVGYFILFVLFFGMSLTASISYSIYTVKKQMYNVQTIENAAYLNLLDQLNKSKDDLTILESDKANELSRINLEMDGLPLNYVTRRKELSDKKLELTNFYDNKISIIKTEVKTKADELSKIDNKPQEVKTLKMNSISAFFETISNVTRFNIDNIIIAFAVALGVILDTGSIALIFDNSFSYQNKRSFNKDINNFKNIRRMQKELKENDNNIPENEDGKILNYNDFIKYISENDIAFDNIKFVNFKSIIDKDKFFNFYYKYKKEMDIA